MRYVLEYGRTGLAVELPERNVVKSLAYRSAQPISSPDQALRDLLEAPTGTPPLAELAGPMIDDDLEGTTTDSNRELDSTPASDCTVSSAIASPA